MPYLHTRDRMTLRAVMQEIKALHGVGPVAFYRRYEAFRAKEGDTEISRETFKRLMDKDPAANGSLKKRAEAAAELCRFVLADKTWREVVVRVVEKRPQSAEMLVEPEPAGQPVDFAALAPEALLSEALLRFTTAEQPVTHIERMRVQYPGRYVMYRADLLPMNGKAEIPPRFRASHVEITLADSRLLITEAQHYPQKGNEGRFDMDTFGVIFPYGTDYTLFLMQAKGKFSFRFGVIDYEYTELAPEGGGYQLIRFHGVILVASSEGLFPSTAFYCLRDDGTLKSGLIPLDEIPIPEARGLLGDAHAKAAVNFPGAPDIATGKRKAP